MAKPIKTVLNTKRNQSTSIIRKKGAEDLTDKELLFCCLYVKYLDISHAALEAGYGSDLRTAAMIGSQLKKEERICKVIRTYAKERLKNTDEDIAFIIHKLFSTVKASLTDYGSWSGRTITLKDSTKLSREKASLITEISQGPFGPKIKLQDSLKAIEILGKYFKLATSEVQEVNTDVHIHVNDTSIQSSLKEFIDGNQRH